MYRTCVFAQSRPRMGHEYTNEVVQGGGSVVDDVACAQSHAVTVTMHLSLVYSYTQRVPDSWTAWSACASM